MWSNWFRTHRSKLPNAELTLKLGTEAKPNIENLTTKWISYVVLDKVRLSKDSSGLFPEENNRAYPF